jgi:hypothetical protein
MFCDTIIAGGKIMKYRIYDLSVRAMLNYSKPDGLFYKTVIDKNALRSCLKHSAHEQDDNALFYQIMCVLHGDDFKYDSADLVTDLSDVIFYADFSRVFDRDASHPYYAQLQEKAAALFTNRGVEIDFSNGMHKYVAFERSASMSRNAVLSFIREDIFWKVTERIRLGMEITKCQLSKLYAYNGLMLSGGIRVDGINLDKPHRVIVVDNQKHTVHDTDVVTVEDDGSSNAVRKYHRVERRESVDILGYDGEGVVSKEFAKVINKKLGGEHTSFQIRLPYIKGMLHQIDIHDFFKSAGVATLTDIWGVEHKAADVDIILTKSMFKGYGWLCENNMSWEDYWDAFRRYKHALYISGVSKDSPQKFTELNYQFLNTLSMTSDEFRPLDLPLSFPANDNRHWLTKETEREYYRLCTDREYRLSFFTGRKYSRGSKDYYLKKILEKNPKFIAEPVYADRLKSRAQAVLKQYALGRLIVAGDNRYLSADLLGFLKDFIPKKAKRNTSQRNFYNGAVQSDFEKNAFYAPSMAYSHSNECTLLRNPHISRNEEVQLQVYPDVENMRKYYLSHLTDVVMVNWDSLTAERLGGADFDGDMIKTISDPIVNRCVKRNSKAETPLLKIPSAEPVIRDATDWQARFETVKSTFSSRVGQISNAALNRSIIAYNENSDDELRDKCREETETLAILTGLEIDSAKSGVKPDLTEYLGTKTVAKSKFLKYKSLLEKSEGRRAWYEPTFEEQFEKFFADTDWDKVDSNVERLPYLAYMLEKNTKTVVDKPADDSELFTFATDENWKDKLSSDKMERIKSLVTDYERCLSRIRACGQPVKDRQRRNDIQRILYSRGQDREYDADMLYPLFQGTPPERITAIRQELQAKNWHLTPKEQREDFLADLIPELERYYPLFSDFRFGGYRVLIDLIADIDDENNLTDRKRLIRDGDSPEFMRLMEAYLNRSVNAYYRDAVAAECRKLIEAITKPDEAVRYIVALGKRKVLFDLLLDRIEKHVRREK